VRDSCERNGLRGTSSGEWVEVGRKDGGWKCRQGSYENGMLRKCTDLKREKEKEMTPCLLGDRKMREEEDNQGRGLVSEWTGKQRGRALPQRHLKVLEGKGYNKRVVVHLSMVMGRMDQETMDDEIEKAGVGCRAVERTWSSSGQ
jgi:hypothetical protein